MIPLFEKVNTGTGYTNRWQLNPLAVYLIKCGWSVGVFVYPEITTLNISGGKP